jgi:hypothetical protein
MRRRVLLVILVALSALAIGACIPLPPPAPAGFADRQLDPVVLTGAQVPALAGVPVGEIVGFAYRDGRWTQAPMQVDQRKTVEMNTVYNQPANTSNPVNVSVYADANTWVGAGSGVFGNADEIAFMAADTGTAAPAGAPANVIAASRVQLQVNDARDGDRAYFYLFRRSSAAVQPSAGRRYVQYTFALTSGSYKATYRLDDGPNPETSRIQTGAYTRSFADRWLDDGLSIALGGARNVDILDRHKVLLGPGVCGRSEDTFNEAEGAFIANINGPVRAIRSYIGANSGPYVQRTHIFYAQREDIVTDLRVHAIPGPVDFFDYSASARGMQYTNEHNSSAVTIDGNADSRSNTAPAWEKVDGPRGALTHVWSVATDIAPLTTELYYEDNDTNPITQCTGDADALGSSGVWLRSNLPNTDPHGGPASKLQATRTVFYEAPGRSTADAQRHASQVASPLTVTVG